MVKELAAFVGHTDESRVEVDEDRFGDDDAFMKLWLECIMDMYPNMRPAELARETVSARELLVEVKLPPMSMDEFEEQKKKWAEELEVGLEDKAKTLNFSELALKYYNAEKDTDFVLVHAKISKMFILCNERIVAHVNFKAKKRNDGDEDAATFFAELEYNEESPVDVISCTILDATIPIQLECHYCHPGSKIQHPVGLFDPECQEPCACGNRWIEYYLGRAGIGLCG